jgi:hypothetical protein
VIHPIDPRTTRLVNKYGTFNISKVDYRATDPNDPLVTYLVGNGAVTSSLSSLLAKGYSLMGGSVSSVAQPKHLYKLDDVLINNEFRLCIIDFHYKTDEYEYTWRPVGTDKSQDKVEKLDRVRFERYAVHSGYVLSENRWGPVKPEQPKVSVCTCGSDAVKAPVHSSWCDKEGVNVSSSGVTKDKAS